MHARIRTALTLLSLCASDLSTPRAAYAQSVYIGRTELVLGMSADDAVRKLSKEFRLQPNHGKFQSWWISSLDTLPDSTFTPRGQIVALHGRITRIQKQLSPDRPTAVSVGEAFFLMLDRLSTDAGGGCQITTNRQGIESGPGAGGTILSATITCPHSEGLLSLYQGSEASMSHDPTIGFVLKSATP